MTKRKNTYSLELVRGVAAHEINYLVRAKAFLHAHSFDELAVILYIAANSFEGEGVTERSVSEYLRWRGRFR